MHAHFAERGSSPSDIFTRLPPAALAPASDGLGASSSRGSLDRERTGSPQLQHPPSTTTSQSPSAHPSVAYRVLSPFKRSHASLSPDRTQFNSSISLAGTTKQQHQQPVKSLLSESNVIRRKLSIILTRQKEPQQRQQRPLSMSSITSSISPQESQQSDSLRSLQTAAESISSRAARVDTSISAATGTSSNTDPPAPPSVPAPAPTRSLPPPPVSVAATAAPAALRRASVYSGSDAPSPADVTASASAPRSSLKDPVSSIIVAAQDTDGTRRGRGQSSSRTASKSCAIQ